MRRVCLKCKPRHKILSIIDGTEENVAHKVNLFSLNDKRMLFQKQNDCLSVFGSGDLLLNPLQFQCPICGTLVALGHCNDILQKGDKVYQHIKSVHYDDAKSSLKGIAYILMKRHEEYLSHNKTCSTPQLIVCDKGSVHEFNQLHNLAKDQLLRIRLLQRYRLKVSNPAQRKSATSLRIPENALKRNSFLSFRSLAHTLKLMTITDLFSYNLTLRSTFHMKPTWRETDD